MDFLLSRASAAFHFGLKIDRAIGYRSNLTLYPDGYFIRKLARSNAGLSLSISDLSFARARTLARADNA